MLILAGCCWEAELLSFRRFHLARAVSQLGTVCQQYRCDRPNTSHGRPKATLKRPEAVISPLAYLVGKALDLYSPPMGDDFAKALYKIIIYTGDFPGRTPLFAT
jgi:hypothetical protein